MREAILLFVFILVGLNGAKDQKWISLRDHEFEGEDPLVQAELTRRMAFDQPLKAPPADFIGGQRQNAPRNAALHATRGDMLDNHPLRRSPEWYNTKQFEGEPTPTNLHAMQLKAMEQAIYSVQFRMQEVEWVMKKYENDLRFKLAFTFKKLDEWRLDMHIMYQHVSLKNNTDPYVLPVARHIVFYTNFLRRNIDITYTIEYLLHQHEMIKQAFTQRQRDTRARLAG